ncbi:hypothetical protein [Desulfotignum balticum]|uniref:hypothetical protein n=1 Tax=Desulfotignum balticum TaxID=115781 RepID=UPI0004628628|nr:hypothetical protein [Desulfotignum balticum]
MNQPVPFMIKFKLAPSEKNKNPLLEHIEGANATIWVFELLEKEALNKATRYVQSLGWEVDSLSDLSTGLPAPLSQMDIRTASAYLDAELLGICGRFDAWPKRPQPGVFYSVPMDKPPKK